MRQRNLSNARHYYHVAKKKPIEEKTPADYGVDAAPRLKVLKVSEPPKRQGGVKVKTVAEFVTKLHEIGAL